MKNWIEVKTDKPVIGEYVWLLLEGQIMLKGRLCNNGWSAYFADGEKLVGTREVTHWMLEPALPGESIEDNKDTPAFPTITRDALETGQIILKTEGAGVTKLEFIACNAPVDIPSWFVHVSPEKVVENPIWQTIANEDDRKHFINWMKDGEYGLPDHLKHYSEVYNKFQNEGDEWRKKDWAARYFQWRRYYAEQLLSTLSKP